MRIPCLRQSYKGYNFETVLFDTASSDNYVWKSHAKKMVFPSWKETMRVSTLGGAIKVIYGVVYQCQIKDLDGKKEEFFAQGLD